MNCPTKEALSKLLAIEPKPKKKIDKGVNVIGGGVRHDPTSEHPSQERYGVPGTMLGALKGLDDRVDVELV